MMTEDLYDIAVKEVRNQASEAEKKALNANPDGWKDALLRVLDEIESQFTLREAFFAEKTQNMKDSDLAVEAEAYSEWKMKALTFKKHISARLLTVSRLTSAVSVEAFARAAKNLDEAKTDEEYDDAYSDLMDLLDTYEASHPIS